MRAQPALGQALPRAGSFRLRAVADYDSSALLLVAALALAGVVMLALLPQSFLQDSWLALVGGREVWTSGVPHHEVLTLIPAGANWIDQQWLSQLFVYGLWRLGGLGLVGLVNVGLVMSGVAGAALAARRLGASAQSLMRLLPFAFWALIFGAQVRTQAYAYPLFAAVLYLLAADSRSPARRTYWCLPLLVLWANIHGSASLGAGLVALRGLTVAWERRTVLVRDVKAWLRPVALVLGPLVCLLATPYGLAIVSYYHDTLLDSGFRSSITEWQPVTSMPFLAAPFFLLAAVAVWSFGRHAGRATLWERLALLVLAVGGITAIRNVPWFAIAALMIVAVSIDAAVRERTTRSSGARRVRPNAAIAAVALLVVLVSAISALGKSARSFEPSYRAGALATVTAATAADSSLKVFAEDKFGDWLLWRAPQLRGRVAYDARFELLGARRLRQLVRIEGAIGPQWKAMARGYRLLVIDTKASPDSLRAFEAEPDARVLYNHGGTAVVLRTAAAAA